MAFCASGCMRRTFLVRTTSRSGCSQLSQAKATPPHSPRRAAAEDTRMLPKGRKRDIPRSYRVSSK